MKHDLASRLDRLRRFLAPACLLLVVLTVGGGAVLTLYDAAQTLEDARAVWGALE